MPKTEVKVNLDVLDSTWRVYDTEIEKIRGTVQEVDWLINQLRSSAWRTNGSDEFFKNYDSSWKKDFDDHITYLEHLRQCLSLAREEYRDAYENNSGLK